MTVNLYKLDSINDYDEAIKALEDYVAELVEEFVEAAEGKALSRSTSRNGRVCWELDRSTPLLWLCL